jgi:hypothetical protein
MGRHRAFLFLPGRVVPPDMHSAAPSMALSTGLCRPGPSHHRVMLCSCRAKKAGFMLGYRGLELHAHI